MVKITQPPILSAMLIDVNKDWGTYRIRNLGAPVDPNDAARKTDISAHEALTEAIHGLASGEYLAKTSRSDQLVARAQMEYPTEDVSLAYLAAINKLENEVDWWSNGFVKTSDSLTDKALEGVLNCEAYGTIYMRLVDIQNAYYNYVGAPPSTADHKICKLVGGSEITLATESIDLTDAHWLKGSISGSTLKSFRDKAATPQLTATDTTFASGVFGVRFTSSVTPFEIGAPLAFRLLAPASPSPKPISLLEVPLTGEGTGKDPYRSVMPEELVDDPTYGKVNRLALPHSALIPCDLTTGSPLHGTALVLIFDQPDRPPYLRSITDAVSALRALEGVTKLAADTAKTRAKQLDDRLRKGEIENMLNPSEPNELESTADFYEREVVDERRMDPAKIPDFDLIIERCIKRSEKVSRADLADRFRRLKRK